MPTQEEVREALKEVEDPELNMGIVDLGLVYGIEIDGPYYSILNFFDRLARQERYINV